MLDRGLSTISFWLKQKPKLRQIELPEKKLRKKKMHGNRKKERQLRLKKKKKDKKKKHK